MNKEEQQALNKSLAQAIMRKLHKKTETLILQGADVNTPYSSVYGSGWTALMEASQKGYHKCVEVLLRHHADVNARTRDGTTALSEALRLFRSETHLDCVYQLINGGG